MESNFTSWKAGCEIPSILHMLPGLVLHPCHINFQVIINTFIRMYEHVYLSAFMNAIFMGRAAGWRFDEGSRLGSQPGCTFFCGFSAYWFPPTVLKHANSVDWSLSCVWNHPIPYRAPTMVFAKPDRVLGEDRCTLYSALNCCSLSKEYIILCGRMQEARHRPNYWLIIRLNINKYINKWPPSDLY